MLIQSTTFSFSRPLSGPSRRPGILRYFPLKFAHAKLPATFSHNSLQQPSPASKHPTYPACIISNIYYSITFGDNTQSPSAGAGARAEHMRLLLSFPNRSSSRARRQLQHTKKHTHMYNIICTCSIYYGFKNACVESKTLLQYTTHINHAV